MTADPSIHTIDTGFQRPDFDAAYLIIENGRAAFVDCAVVHWQRTGHGCEDYL